MTDNEGAVQEPQIGMYPSPPAGYVVVMTGTLPDGNTFSIIHGFPQRRSHVEGMFTFDQMRMAGNLPPELVDNFNQIARAIGVKAPKVGWYALHEVDPNTGQ